MASGSSSQLAEWKRVKQVFEKNTGKKKPSEKIMGAFRKSTGIESALKEVDKAWNDLENLKAAYKEFRKVKTAYNKTLGDAGKKDSAGENYKIELGRMTLDLENIEGAISDRVQALGG